MTADKFYEESDSYDLTCKSQQLSSWLLSFQCGECRLVQVGFSEWQLNKNHLTFEAERSSRRLWTLDPTRPHLTPVHLRKYPLALVFWKVFRSSPGKWTLNAKFSSLSWWCSRRAGHKIFVSSLKMLSIVAGLGQSCCIVMPAHQCKTCSIASTPLCTQAWV